MQALGGLGFRTSKVVPFGFGMFFWLGVYQKGKTLESPGRVQDSGFWVQGTGLRVHGLGIGFGI